MLKKTLSVLFVICILGFCLLPAAAQMQGGPIKVKLNSNIAGLTQKDVEKLFELQSDNVEYRERSGGPILISDYAGTGVSGKLVAGRTYYIHYCMDPVEGVTLPEKLTDEDISITCGKGVSVISKQITYSHVRQDDGTYEDFRGVTIYAEVVVDGNVFQRVIGWFHDLILKIRAWSLY